MSSSARFRVNYTRTVAEQYSDDTSTKTGALIVPKGGGFVCAANTFPAGVANRMDRNTRPEKYAWMEHAERNAIYRCARKGLVTEGAKMYISHHPCADCARAIIQAGITELYMPATQWEGDGSKNWGFAAAEAMLREAGVKVTEVVE